MEIRLLVLRTKDIELLAVFYRLLGISFDHHQHGPSPFHYSASIGKMVLEIYPLAKGQVVVDEDLRLGFAVDDLDATIALLIRQQVKVISGISATAFGNMAVILDPDGRKIELYQQS